MERLLPLNMKFEDTIMEGNKRHLKKLTLQEEIEMLQGDLEREQSLNKILKIALQGPAILPPSDCSLIPRQVQVLLAELVWEEEQIITLERKVRELKLNMYQGSKQSRKWDLHQKSELQYKEVKAKEKDRHARQYGRMHDYEQMLRKGKMIRDRMTFSGHIFGRR